MDSDTITKKDKYRHSGGFERAGVLIGGLLGPGWLRGRLRSLYHHLLLLRTGGRGIQSNLPGGESMRVLPGYRFASWNLVEYEAFKATVRRGDVALDVGANIGTYSVLFGQWVGPEGKVFAFEPAPETFSALCRHIEMNGLREIVSALPNAISDHSATLNFIADNFQGTNRLAGENESRDGSPSVRQVQALTIDDFCEARALRPDFIKIDIEGFELAALRGARRTIKAGRGKLTLFVEMHPTTWQTLGISRDDILTELDHQNLRADPLTQEGDPWKVEGICMRLVAR